ncbi:MAG: cysteine desulfurase [Mariniblastus sp.]
MTDFIYLDHNSTTPIDPSVAAVIADCHSAGYMNPASQHRPGQLARRKLEEIRRRVAEILDANCVGMQTDQLIFTSGGTESNNLAILGLVGESAGKTSSLATPTSSSRRVLISAIEHPSVFGAAEQLVRLGFDVEKIPVDSNGVIDLDALNDLTDQPTELVSIMLANNETGVIQPVRLAADLCRQKGILIHTDAVQAVGKIPVSFQSLGVDALTFTAHKLNGPRGIGGLLLRHGVTPHPILFGGFQQTAIRPGTEDVALAAGFRQSFELFVDDLPNRSKQMSTLRLSLEQALLSRFADLVINGVGAERVPHTSNISFPGVDRQSFLMAADMSGLAISTGSACASGSSELSPVLLAMGLELPIVEGSIRISLGISTTPQEVDESVHRIAQIIKSIRS